MTVLEEAPQLRTGGAAISVWNNGGMALWRLRIELDCHGRVIDRLEFWSSKGAHVGWVDAAGLNRKFGIDAVTIPRSELLEQLAARLHSGTIRFGARCEGIHPLGVRAVAKVAGGEDLEADLVVGADGHRSVVRTPFAPAGLTTPTGWASLQGLTAAPLALTDGCISVYATVAEGRIGMMPTGGGLLPWWFDVPWPRCRRQSPLGSGTASPAGSLQCGTCSTSSRMTRSEPFPHGWHAAPRRLQMSQVVLIGDAVLAIPPVLAQGANQSIEDAWILCRELEAAPSSISARCRAIKRNAGAR